LRILQWIACCGAMLIVATETLALVTVTHNSAGELGALLASIDRHLPGVELVVVDSASSDETVAVARSASSRARVQTIALDRNVGFGRGCNIGVAAVTQGVTALVNPDVELLDDSLLELAHEALRLPEAAARAAGAQRRRLPAGHRASATDHRPPIWDGCWCLQGSPAAGLTAACAVEIRRPPTGRLGGRLRARRADCHAAAPGAVRRADLLYYEDLDLGLRADEEGVETWFCPSARVLHHRAHSSDRSSGASRSSCWPAPAGTSSRAASVRGRQGSTTRHRPPRSRRGS